MKDFFLIWTQHFILRLHCICIYLNVGSHVQLKCGVEKFNLNLLVCRKRAINV